MQGFFVLSIEYCGRARHIWKIIIQRREIWPTIITTIHTIIRMTTPTTTWIAGNTTACG